MKQIILVLAITVSSLISCSPSRFVKPLDQGEKVISGSFGGPMAKVPGVGTIPIPFTSISYGQGITDKTTVFGGFYPTASMFGVFQFDLGGSFGIIKNEKWGITASPTLNLAFDKWDKNFKVWPYFDLNFYYQLNFNKEEKSTSLLMYGGFNNWFELSKQGAHNRPQDTHYLWSPQIGIELIKEKWSYQIEYKLIAPNKNNENFTVSYSSILPRSGANGLFIGVTRKF